MTRLPALTAALALVMLPLGPTPAEPTPEPTPTVYAIASIPQPYDMEAERHALYEAAETNVARKTAARVGVARRQVASTSRAAHRRAHSGDPWAALIRCESSGNPRAVSPSGKYRGLLQFDLATWASVGMTGDPIDHPAAVQLEAGKRLHARRGWKPWPACARKLGLR